MREEWLQEILERLSRENGSSPEIVREEMEQYLEGILRGEVRASPREEKILRRQQGSSINLGEYLDMLSREMELERQKEREILSYLGEGIED